MTLNLTITNPNTDYGRYHCVCKNDMGTTRGDIDVFGNYIRMTCNLKVVRWNGDLALFVSDEDPRFAPQPAGENGLKTWGPAPPDLIDLEVNLI